MGDVCYYSLVQPCLIFEGGGGGRGKVLSMASMTCWLHDFLYLSQKGGCFQAAGLCLLCVATPCCFSLKMWILHLMAVLFCYNVWIIPCFVLSVFCSIKLPSGKEIVPISIPQLVCLSCSGWTLIYVDFNPRQLPSSWILKQHKCCALKALMDHICLKRCLSCCCLLLMATVSQNAEVTASISHRVRAPAYPQFNRMRRGEGREGEQGLVECLYRTLVDGEGCLGRWGESGGAKGQVRQKA